jgi:tripartite-type tricarboxylate transporter receptor subunit TctC
MRDRRDQALRDHHHFGGSRFLDMTTLWRHMRRSFTVLIGCEILLSAFAVQAVAQSYPERPLRFVIPFPPGGGADNLARIVGQKVGDTLGQQIVIDNRAGAGGNIAAEVAARASPDGYTLLQGNVAHTISRSLYRKLNYDFLKDFAPVTQLASIPFMLLAHPALPAASVKDLIALARGKPGELNYASSGAGGPSHMAMELFKSMAQVEIRHIPYKGAAPAATDLMAGRVQMMFFTLSAGLPHVKSGKLKALAVAGARRIPQAPDVPTVDESGLRGFEASTWFGVLVPAGTPNQVITKLHSVFTAALHDREVRERLAAQGFELVGSTPKEFGAYIRTEIPKWAGVIKASGVTIN